MAKSMLNPSAGNRKIDISDGFMTQKNLLQEKMKNMYGEEQTVENTQPKKINPYLNSKGELINSYADYQPLLDSDRVSNRVKTWITEATGKTPTVKNTNETVTESNTTSNSESNDLVSDKNSIFNGSYDNSVLGSLDIKTQLPKLTVNQISTIISKHFNKSSVITPDDAKGIYDAQMSTGMSALAILGIGALESGWGTSKIAKEKNNIWGYGATNDNPGGNAHSYSKMSEGASQFAQEFMKTYYNGYGAKSINSAGTGDNPAGMGYAYFDYGGIDPSWATKVSSIMGTLYDTAKTVQPQQTSYSSNTSSSSSSNTSAGQKLVDTAKKYLGTKYVWGGSTPDGFDCSGLVQYVANQNGIKVNRTSQEQFKNGTAVSKENLQPGDLVFFKGSDGTSTSPGHVGIYVGQGQYIQAPKTGDVVKISNLSGRSDYIGARRIV